MSGFERQLASLFDSERLNASMNGHEMEEDINVSQCCVRILTPCNLSFGSWVSEAEAKAFKAGDNKRQWATVGDVKRQSTTDCAKDEVVRVELEGRK